MKGKCGKGKSGPIGRIEETPWTPPPGQYHPRETEAVSPPPPTEQSLPETTLETELESMMDEMEAGQAAHHAADPTPTPTPSVPTPVLTPQSSAPATPRVPDPEASPPTEGQTEKTDDGEEAEEEKERNDKACFFGDMVNLQYAYIEIYIYTHQHTHLSKLNVACQEGVRRSLTMQSTGTGPTQTIKGLAVRGPDGKLQRVTWFMVCLLHVLEIQTIYIYIYIYFLYFSNIVEHNICRGQRIDP